MAKSIKTTKKVAALSHKEAIDLLVEEIGDRYRIDNNNPKVEDIRGCCSAATCYNFPTDNEIEDARDYALRAANEQLKKNVTAAQADEAAAKWLKDLLADTSEGGSVLTVAFVSGEQQKSAKVLYDLGFRRKAAYEGEDGMVKMFVLIEKGKEVNVR